MVLLPILQLLFGETFLLKDFTEQQNSESAWGKKWQINTIATTEINILIKKIMSNIHYNYHDELSGFGLQNIGEDIKIQVEW